MTATLLDSAYERLIFGRESERTAAQATLLQPEQQANWARLREQIMTDVRDKYSHEQELRQSDPGIKYKRSWLINTLAKLSDGDLQALDLVKHHLDPKVEKDIWVRYWALEGLISIQADDLEEVARQVVARDREPLLTQTARAVLARRGDFQSQRHLEEAFATGDLLWATLRALRVVPINAFFERLAPIVEAGAYTDETYDAIVALGQAPCASEHANQASLSLEKFVTKFRVSPMRDGMRLMALHALGELGVEARAPLLIEELTDDNPSTVREAARSLEKLLGLRTAAARVLEAACKSEPDKIEAFGRALRWMKREALVDELENLMSSLPLQEQQVARNLLSEIGGAAAFQKLRASTKAIAHYTEALQAAETRISDLFKASIEEARSGFKMAGIMDVCVFGAGLFLILASAVAALLGPGDLSGWAGVGMAGGGTLGVIYGVLIAKPREKIVEGVNHLMHVKLIFLGYLRDLHQIDQSFTRWMLEEKPLPLEEVNKFRLMVEQAMTAGIDQIARLKNNQPAAPAPGPSPETPPSPALPPAPLPASAPLSSPRPRSSASH
jgi:hypothetical protein